MTLKTVQDLKNQIVATMPDNTSGQITPSILRTALLDMCDSLFSRSATLYGQFSGGLAQSITTTPTNYPVLMPSVINNNPTLFTVNALTGLITAAMGGFGYTFSINMVFEGAINQEVDGVMYKNGVAYARATVVDVAGGAGKLRTASAEVIAAGIIANDVFEFRLSSPQGPTSITFRSLDFTVSLNPTLTSL